jgi:hypothetical protein
MAEKTCPKCPNSPPLNKLDSKNIVPALVPADFSVSTKTGLYVQPYVCPHCQLVEFYHIER